MSSFSPFLWLKNNILSKVLLVLFLLLILKSHIGILHGLHPPSALQLYYTTTIYSSISISFHLLYKQKLVDIHILSCVLLFVLMCCFLTRESFGGIFFVLVFFFSLKNISFCFVIFFSPFCDLAYRATPADDAFCRCCCCVCVILVDGGRGRLISNSSNIGVSSFRERKSKNLMTSFLPLRLCASFYVSDGARYYNIQLFKKTFYYLTI